MATRTKDDDFYKGFSPLRMHSGGALGQAIALLNATQSWLERAIEDAITKKDWDTARRLQDAREDLHNAMERLQS